MDFQCDSIFDSQDDLKRFVLASLEYSKDTLRVNVVCTCLVVNLVCSIFVLHEIIALQRECNVHRYDEHELRHQPYIYFECFARSWSILHELFSFIDIISVFSYREFISLPTCTSPPTRRLRCDAHFIRDTFASQAHNLIYEFVISFLFVWCQRHLHFLRIQFYYHQLTIGMHTILLYICFYFNLFLLFIRN